MKRIMLCAAVVASLAVTAAALADGTPPPIIPESAQPTTISPSTGGASGINPFAPLCSISSVSYQLFGAGNSHFVQFRGTGSCLNTAAPWFNWRYGGKTQSGMPFSGNSYLAVIRVKVTNLGKPGVRSFSLSYTIGDGQGGSATCSFRPNFSLGYTAVQLCH